MHGTRAADAPSLEMVGFLERRTGRLREGLCARWVEWGCLDISFW